jgi:hypothetical protein
MRYNEFSRILVEAVVQEQPISRPEIISALAELGYGNVKVDGNKLRVLTQIPDGARSNEFRAEVMNEILAGLQEKFPDYNPKHIKSGKFGSQGGIVFDNSPVAILVKDEGGQGDKSAGVANEIELAAFLESVIEKYKTVNVTFVDPHGKKISIKDCNKVVLAGKDVSGRKKADVVLKSESGELPISIKKLNADMWESADRLFGKKAKEILEKLQADGVLKLKKFVDDTGRKYYKLDKEIVIEPTEEQAMEAIFGSDLNPKGGVVIQTFKPEHYVQNENNVTVQCYHVIAKKEDIPESHLMVWLIRNNVERNNPLPGLRTLGVTLSRGIGKKGTKDVILVDKNGNVLENPNATKKNDVERVEKEKKKPEPGSKEAIGRERR